MRILEKTEMKRLPGSFSCVFQLRRNNNDKIISWLKNENALYTLSRRFDYNLICAELTGEQLTMLALTFAE